MPKAEASLPSARERRVPWATPAIESTMASRSWRSFSFCLRINGSSFFSRWFNPKSAAGERVAASLFDFDDFAGRFAAIFAFFETGLFALTLRSGLGSFLADRALRTGEFFATFFL